jgi:hypothetical protein
MPGELDFGKEDSAMTQFEKIAVPMFLILGTILGGLWLSSASSKPETFEAVARNSSAQPAIPASPTSTERYHQVPASGRSVASSPTPAPAARERYYQDRHGAIVSEIEIERGLEILRSDIRSMPDNGLRAFKEGQLEALEEEWARMKRKGPVEPLRVTVGKGKEILVGEAPLPESKRRRIFFELVQAQDSGVGDRQAYALIANRHGISVLTANEIAYEGAAKKWPMP